MDFFMGLLRDARGASAIEYAFIALFIAIEAITGLSAIGGKLPIDFIDVANSLPS